MRRPPDPEAPHGLALHRPLPVLGPRGMALVQAMTDPDMDFARLANVVQDYPSVAARLIAMANSAWSAPVTLIDSLDQACARLGFDVVRSLSIALAISAPFDLNACPSFDARRFWARALLAAEGAALLAPRMAGDPALPVATARTAGLLHNLGLLLLADRMPVETSAALAAAAGEGGSAVRDALKACCGISQNEAGGYLAEAWRLPPVLAHAMLQRMDDADDGRRWRLHSPVGVGVVLAAAAQQGATAVPADPCGPYAVADADLDDAWQQLRARATALSKLADALVGP